jgi:hypothetical protein
MSLERPITFLPSTNSALEEATSPRLLFRVQTGLLLVLVVKFATPHCLLGGSFLPVFEEPALVRPLRQSVLVDVEVDVLELRKQVGAVKKHQR